MTHPQKKYKSHAVLRRLFRLTPMVMVLFAFTVRAEIYSWTDEQGVRHFSDRPPQHFVDVHVLEETPHDKIADKKHDDAHRQMMEEVAANQRERKETAETETLKRRLEKAERQSRAAQKKAEEAMEAAKQAQVAASEKQRYREVYVIPQKRIGPYPRHVITTPPGGY
jgi:hypothetical protein